MKKFRGYALGASFALVVMFAQTSTANALIANLPVLDPDVASDPEVVAKFAQIQDLMKKIEDLQNQLANTDFNELTLKEGLEEGVTDEDIEDVQELLSTDPEIYPEGLVTGYFGPLTTAALERFQARHAIRISGEIDAETRELILGYFEEAENGRIPADLLQFPNIDRKIKLRLTTENEVRLKINCNTRNSEDELTCKLKNKNLINSASEEEALTAIARAETAIDILKKKIEEAEDKLVEAEDVLAEAAEAFEDDKFTTAERKAKEAEDAAVMGL